MFGLGSEADVQLPLGTVLDHTRRNSITVGAGADNLTQMISSVCGPIVTRRHSSNAALCNYIMEVLHTSTQSHMSSMSAMASISSAKGSS